MRIVTWNVNSIKARADYVLDYFATRAPDIVCLQELKVPDDDFPFDRLSDLGYEAAVHGQRQWNGVAVVARNPTTITQEGLPGCGDAGARLVTADVSGVSVTSVYVPNGKTVEHDDFALKLRWLDALIEYLAGVRADAGPMIVAGDFNLCPADVDSYHPDAASGAIFHTAAERDRYRRIVELGLVDIYRAVAPNDPGYSWWDYRGGSFHKGMGLRIDLLLATPDLAQSVTSVAVDRTFRKKRPAIPDVKPSDHAPVEAMIRGGPSPPFGHPPDRRSLAVDMLGPGRASRPSRVQPG